MERNTAYAKPQEGSHIVVHANCQNPDYTREKTASVLNVPGNAVSIEMKRAGGGFGSLFSRQMPVVATVSVAAQKLRRPIKMKAQIRDDFQVTGGGSFIETEYTVSFDSDGTITSLTCENWVDAGCGTDMTGELAQEFTNALDNVYFLANCDFRTHVMKTHNASTTALRSFGHAQVGIHFQLKHLIYEFSFFSGNVCHRNNNQPCSSRAFKRSRRNPRSEHV